MIVTEDSGFASQVLDEMMAENSDERTHPSVTDLNQCITKSWYNSRMQNRPFTDQTKVFFAIGLATEAGMLTQRKTKEDTGTYEGIGYHIDAGYNNEVIELKTTRKSPKNYELDIPIMHLRQMKAYAHIKGTLYVKYIVVFLIQAEVKCWNIEFTLAELAEHWAWMQDRAEVWKESDQFNASPMAYQYNEPWECKLCDYKVLCEYKSKEGK